MPDMKLIVNDDPITQSDREMDERMVAIVRLNMKKALVRGCPVAKYDRKLKKTYFLYADGRKVYNDDKTT